MKIIQLSFFALILYTQCIQAQTSEKKEVPLNLQLKNEVLDTLLKKLNELYVFSGTAITIEKTIRQFQKKNYYSNITDSKAFADTLTKQLFAITHDKHLSVSFNEENQSLNHKAVADKNDRERKFQRFKIQKNFGFTKIDVLDGNIGYLKIEAFFPVNEAAPIAAAAMNYLTNTDALIIDLRQNHGGEPEMVQFFASYFFGVTPVHLNDLFWREGSRTVQYWTLDSIVGKRYLDKPVYILTSKETFSAGEEFTYDLQTLKRAVVIGETTAGGANPGSEIIIKKHFVAFIPNGRAINPVTKTNWEGTGVKPDVQTTAGNTFPEAHVIALKKLVETTADKSVKDFFQANLTKIQATIK